MKKKIKYTAGFILLWAVISFLIDDNPISNELTGWIRAWLIEEPSERTKAILMGLFLAFVVAIFTKIGIDMYNGRGEDY